MQQWQVGPVPEYVYSNSTHQPNDMHQPNPYQPQADMARRNDQQHFAYGAPHAQPNMQNQQPHHQAAGQPAMNVPQQPAGTTPSQQQTPTQTPTPQPSRQRKRPNPSTAAPPATATPTPAAAPAPQQAHQQPPPQQQQQQQQATPVQAHAQAQPPPPAMPHGAPPAAHQQQPAQAPQPQAPTPTADAATPVSQPPAKKSRTNTPWTPQEELRLKQMRDAGSSWAEIAKTFPTRTEGSVKKHWYKDMHYAEFAEDEKQALLNAIKDYENNKWKVIGQKVGKPAKACEQYAKDQFPELFGTSKGR
ncbi:hypothetical protein N3K66_007612 [Trichothecium roseum]|uniref:Uncharacterized protein n=1 Tax=Trichothecium roseum TaxID=47278 RepID=A0ACC0UUG5_9HYPO|nr:hypothetical protein N3K66_007612 [Trichothecium roseum]